MMIALPIMLQNGITNFVNMLDNIMVGRIGTDPMTGVSIVNSLLFVWNLCVFGGLSGIGIFTAQYCGKSDDEGVRKTFRLQIITSVLLVLIGITVFAAYGEQLINLYLHEDGGGGSVEATMQAALSYLGVMCIGFLPFALTQSYGTTIRSYGETVAPMIASFLAVGVNLVGNYVLIFGDLGAHPHGESAVYRRRAAEPVRAGRPDDQLYPERNAAPPQRGALVRRAGHTHAMLQRPWIIGSFSV